MKDRITKKRVKVDYSKIIHLLGLDRDFIDYVISKRSSISGRRKALAFLNARRVDIHSCYLYLQDFPFDNYADLLKRQNGDLSYFYKE